MGLLDFFVKEGGKFIKDALPGGLLNPEVTSQSVLDGAAIASSPVPVLGDLLGLGADLNRYKNEPESRTLGNFALSGMGLLPFVPAMTAWHGSPHKFDKFSLDKIGTGEGAQAYGHGLYLAESPEVAQQYQHNLTANQLRFDGKPIEQLSMIERDAADYATRYGGKQQALDVLNDNLQRKSKFDDLDYMARVKERLAAADFQKPEGALYKTDIPDEAVARFLDWDKPLSQQAPEVQAGLNNFPGSMSGADAYAILAARARPGVDYSAKQRGGGGFGEASSALSEKGIPGIRYLDGGSRSAGQGSSNFVAFDPEMIRILERNGQPTGLQPWKPGEYRLGDLLK